MEVKENKQQIQMEKGSEARAEGTKKTLTLAQRLRLSNYKQLLRIATMILGLLVIILMSLFQLQINKQWSWVEWTTSTIIMIGISLFGLYMGDSSWEDHLKTVPPPSGLYQTALANFNEQEKKVHKELAFFSGYYTIHCVNELIQKKANYLANEGIPGDECIILAKYLREYDLPEIFNHEIERQDESGNLIHLCKLEKSKEDSVRDMLKLNLRVANYTYFLRANAEQDTSGVAENSKIIPQKRRASKRFNFVMKIIATAIFSLIFAIFTTREYAYAEGGEAARQATMNLVTRICHLVTSFVAGCGTGVIDIRLAADELDNKTLMLNEYEQALAKGLYTTETYEEKWSRQRKEREEEEKKAREMVVEPEVVEPTPEPAPKPAPELTPIEQKGPKQIDFNVDTAVGSEIR